MRIFYFILLFFVSFFSYSQKELNLDNSVTCNTIQSDNIKNIGFNYNGENSLSLKRFNIDLNTNYNYLTNTENELNQKLNFSYKWSQQQIFLTYQFNASYIRGINSDNWIGIGYGFKKKIKSLNTSLSYATIYQSELANDTYTEQFRHSIRFRLKYEGKLVALQTEYFYQPTFETYKNYIVYGTSKLILLPEKKLNFIIQDLFNYNSGSNILLVHNMSFGIQYKFNKKF